MTLTFDLFVIVFGQGKRFNPKWSEVSVSRQKETNIPIILKYLKYSCLMVNEPSKFTISINSEKHSKTLTKLSHCQFCTAEKLPPNQSKTNRVQKCFTCRKYVIDFGMLSITKKFDADYIQQFDQIRPN